MTNLIMARAQSKRTSSAQNREVEANAPSALPVASHHGSSLRQLAHELNSLLDGSMRCVGLARTSLQQQPLPGVNTIEDGLSKAHAAMRHMAALLERAMRQAQENTDAPVVAIFASTQTVANLMNEITGLTAPHAQSAGATITVELADDCGDLPAGPLGPVLLNGVRNALQVCEASIQPKGPAHIVIRITRDKQDLHLIVDGPAGPKPSGHQIGMGLSQQIVEEVGGIMALTTGTQRTTLRLSVPIHRLTSHA